MIKSPFLVSLSGAEIFLSTDFTPGTDSPSKPLAKSRAIAVTIHTHECQSPSIRRRATKLKGVKRHDV